LHHAGGEAGAEAIPKALMILMPFVFMVGTYAEGPARVGFVEKDSPAEKAGLHASNRQAWKFVVVRDSVVEGSGGGY
jgi:hypothetical protein